jgi:hypothetical protein
MEETKENVCETKQASYQKNLSKFGECDEQEQRWQLTTRRGLKPTRSKVVGCGQVFFKKNSIELAP